MERRASPAVTTAAWYTHVAEPPKQQAGRHHTPRATAPPHLYQGAARVEEMMLWPCCCSLRHASPAGSPSALACSASSTCQPSLWAAPSSRCVTACSCSDGMSSAVCGGRGRPLRIPAGWVAVPGAASGPGASGMKPAAAAIA